MFFDKSILPGHTAVSMSDVAQNQWESSRPLLAWATKNPTLAWSSHPHYLYKLCTVPRNGMVSTAGMFINLLMPSCCLPHARVTSSLFLLCLHLDRAQFAGFSTPTLPCQEVPVGDQSLLPSGNPFPKYSHLADFLGLPFQRTLQGLLWAAVLESA